MSMGMTSARHLRECVRNAEVVVALEALAAAQGLELRAPLARARATAAALAAVRAAAPALVESRALKPDVDAVVELVQSGGLLAAVEGEIGALA